MPQSAVALGERDPGLLDSETLSADTEAMQQGQCPGNSITASGTFRRTARTGLPLN